MPLLLKRISSLLLLLFLGRRACLLLVFNVVACVRTHAESLARRLWMVEEVGLGDVLCLGYFIIALPRLLEGIVQLSCHIHLRLINLLVPLFSLIVHLSIEGGL